MHRKLKMNIPRRQLFLLVLFFFLWRVVLFAWGNYADHFLPYAPTFPYADDVLVRTHMPRWLYSWANFDGVHYLLIADYGYKGIGLVQAFFPLYPFVILHTFRVIFDGQLNVFLFGLLISNFFGLSFLITLFGFVKEKINTQTAWCCVWVFFLWPTSFFLGAEYTESLFLFLVIVAFWSAEKKCWWMAGVATALASSSRVVGIFLIPALLIELWQQQRFSRNFGSMIKHHWPELFWIGFGSLGLLSYMTFLQLSEFHDPLYFAHVQKEFGAGRQEQLVFYPQVVWRALHILFTARPFDWRYFAYVQEFFTGTVLLVLLLMSKLSKHVRWSYMFFALAAFFLPTLTGTFSSMPRYFLACFCTFIFLAEYLQKVRVAKYIWLLISFIFLLINTLLFIQGHWVA